MNKNKVIFNQLLVCDTDHLQLPKDADQVLSQAERTRLANITQPKQANTFLVGRYLLRQLLARQLHIAPAELTIAINPKGKPQLQLSDARSLVQWHFNLSHSQSLLALALSNQAPLGLDIESRQLNAKQILRLAKRYFNEWEQSWLASNPQPENFLRLWTIKEAVLKADGAGIANNLAAVMWQPEHNEARFGHCRYQLNHYLVHGASKTLPSRLTLAIQSEHAPPWQQMNVADLALALEIHGPQPNLETNMAATSS
ncbi:4'-phosphopantetheinyl transferase family protein [Oceanisphaera avium]|uniref:Uncharacterized protein n=1 Tax=Oceanisphaera avium TaxID=1903694 RepID=A0A1Y0CTQ1_9GAMM|nr:4'-phosphopantetheinyl transferase superfamily protein [Oceanisphaera avium]ART78731.1 hypothetical protein CBP12_00015 [Oceanisphaera avium]